MKKAKITFCVLVALGIIWTGSAWLTGKKIEHQLTALIQQTNITLTETLPTAGLKISQQDYQRGIFSSTAQLIIEPVHQDDTDKKAQSGQQIVIEETIEHGPLPFSRLKTFQFMPAMASIHSKLVNNDTVRPFFTETPNTAPLTGDTHVSYRGTVTSAINLLPLDFTIQETGEHLATSASAVKIAYDSRQNSIKLNATIDQMVMTLPGDEAEPVSTINVSGFSLNNDTHQGATWVASGEQSISLKKITVIQNNLNTMQLDGLSFRNSIDADNKMLNWKIQYALDNLIQKDQPFGQSQLTLSVSSITPASLKQFFDNVRTQTTALSKATVPTEKQPDQADDEAYQQIWQDNLPLLLKDNPEIKIAPFSWKNNKGESHFSLSVTLNAPSVNAGEGNALINEPNSDDSDNGENPDERKLTQDVDRVIKKLDSSLLINKAMARELIKRQLIAEGDNENTAEKNAEKQTEQLSQRLQDMGLAIENNDQITSSLQYDAGKITANGNTMSAGRFLTRAIMNLLSPSVWQHD